MSEVIATIEVDLGPLSEEWEAVAFRVPVCGSENWVSPCGTEIRVSRPADCADGPRLIVRRRWKWPEWLTAEWICQNSALSWLAFLDEPMQNEYGWTGFGAHSLSGGAFDFTPPACTDWRQSKRRNPRSRAAKGGA